MANNILTKLFIKKPKNKRQVTALFTDDDKFLTLKALPLPVKNAEIFTAVLNEQQALGFWITPSDKITITKSNWEKLVTNIAVSSKIPTWNLWVYENVLERFPLEKWEIVAIEVAESSSIANEAIRKKMKWEIKI